MSYTTKGYKTGEMSIKGKVMKKTQQQAAEVVRSLQGIYAKGVIKSWEIPLLVNIKTGENTGFAVIIYLASKYEYTNGLLNDWKEKLSADEYTISAKKNQLQVKFTIRY